MGIYRGISGHIGVRPLRVMLRFCLDNTGTPQTGVSLNFPKFRAGI